MVIQKLLVEEGIKRGLKESQKYSVSVLGYDFIGLVSRLAVFFVMAFLINSYFIATIQGGIWLNSLGSFLIKISIDFTTMVKFNYLQQVTRVLHFGI